MDKLSQYISDNKDKKVLIWGLGLQGGGESAVRFFAKFTNQIRITDLKTKDQLKRTLDKLSDLDLELSLDSHKDEDFIWADIILVNQDIFNKAPDSPYFSLIKKNNKKLETQTGLFFKLCACPIIGVTGTRGKTTTTIAIAKLLENAGKKIVLGGNIPNSQNLDAIENTKDADFAVLELSNYQLHGLDLEKLSPHIAVLTSISPDHLISYKNQEEYLGDKKVICKYQHQLDYFIIKKNIDHKSFFLRDISSKIIEFDKDTIPFDWQLKLSGDHSRENLGSIYQLGKILNINEDIIKETIINFTSVKYRLETIAEYNGITFVNDTTATTPTAATIALKSFPVGKIIWIAGGNSKGLPQDELVEAVKKYTKKIILLEGNATPGLKNDLENQIEDFNSKYLGIFNDFQKAIQTASDNAENGDIILLSPGFTSFGMFTNEFQRGDLFNQYVEKLIS